jgi:hypothetical protein
MDQMILEHVMFVLFSHMSSDGGLKIRRSLHALSLSCELACHRKEYTQLILAMQATFLQYVYSVSKAGSYIELIKPFVTDAILFSRC